MSKRSKSKKAKRNSQAPARSDAAGAVAAGSAASASNNGTVTQPMAVVRMPVAESPIRAATQAAFTQAEAAHVHVEVIAPVRIAAIAAGGSVVAASPEAFDDLFFVRAADDTPSLAPLGVDVDEQDEDPRWVRRRLSFTPEGRARRAHLARYVGAAVALCGALALAGYVRSSKTDRASGAQFLGEPVANAAAVKSDKSDVKSEIMKSDIKAEAPKTEAPAAQPVPIAIVPAKPEEVAKRPPQPEVVPAAVKEQPKASESVATEVVAEPPKAELDPKAAKTEKIAAQRALERGKMADAIEAGERSVALDPTDAEAWLILGAAYQEKGKGAEARRCFTACVKEAKRGPKGECAAMGGR